MHESGPAVEYAANTIFLTGVMAVGEPAIPISSSRMPPLLRKEIDYMGKNKVSRVYMRFSHSQDELG